MLALRIGTAIANTVRYTRPVLQPAIVVNESLQLLVLQAKRTEI